MPFELATPRAEGLPKATHCQLKACVRSEELHLGKIYAAAQFGVTATSPFSEGTKGESCARIHHGCELGAQCTWELQLGGRLFFGVKVWDQKTGPGRHWETGQHLRESC